MLIVAGCDMSKLHHYQYASVTPLRDYKFKDKRVVSYNIDVLESDEVLAIWCEGSRSLAGRVENMRENLQAAEKAGRCGALRANCSELFNILRSREGGRIDSLAKLPRF